ncbi:hypothetical protein WR25_22432 [Diploscapter pachys]|uniref:Calcium uniporter protein n=1 Tax=Diploscapter pachys TaxID=2018661 RepID=A0A2A2LUG3_9BILA|nr:hypothetical protein WR25_22432 [Diploscapter pachys]
MRHRALILLKSALFEVNSASGCRKIPLKFDLKYGGFQKAFCSNSPSSSSFPDAHGTLKIEFERGLPVVTVPLPSRQESCQFSMRPLSDSVGSLCEALKSEDKGLDVVSIYAKCGTRISNSTPIEHLLQFGDFQLRLNDKYFQVDVPKGRLLTDVTSEQMRQLDDLKATVASLHAGLCVDEYKLSRERNLLVQLEKAEDELRPLHEEKLQIEHECELFAERIMWGGFVTMCVQTGIFGRLTFWDYSWDIIEPITYFATYSTVIATLGYYLYTKQNFEYPAARERVFTKDFYKRAKKRGFDVERYNSLVKEVESLRRQLARIRDPLFQHLPVSYLSKLDKNP